jgi:hypothetical protein
MILAFAYWQRGRLWAAGAALAGSLYIKLFGIAVALCWMVFPRRAKSLAAAAAVIGALALLPLVLTSPGNLLQQYQNWFTTLEAEFPRSEGISMMGMLHAWFGLTGRKTTVVLIGGLALVAPLIRWRSYSDDQFRFGLLSSILIWVVLFNHRAESATFVIATCGIALWFVTRPMTRLNTTLVIATLILSGFANSEIMPEWVQQHILEPYRTKAVPALLVWLKIQYELWTTKPRSQPAQQRLNEAPELRLAA